MCPICSDKENKIELTITKRYRWISNNPSIIKGEMECPNCYKKFWVKENVK